MIDRKARDILAENFRHLVCGQISNDQFEDRLKKSKDAGVCEVFYKGAWPLYDDLHEHKLTGKRTQKGQVSTIDKRTQKGQVSTIDKRVNNVSLSSRNRIAPEGSVWQGRFELNILAVTITSRPGVTNRRTYLKAAGIEKNS